MKKMGRGPRASGPPSGRAVLAAQRGEGVAAAVDDALGALQPLVPARARRAPGVQSQLQSCLAEAKGADVWGCRHQTAEQGEQSEEPGWTLEAHLGPASAHMQAGSMQVQSMHTQGRA